MCLMSSQFISSFLLIDKKSAPRKTLTTPFMDKRLAEFVLAGKKIGYNYVYINTNGALASPEKVKPVIDAACSREFFRPTKDGALPTTTISVA